MRIVTNHWGWSPIGVFRWIRYGWARPVEVWGLEVTGSVPRTFERRVKIGPVCFGFGSCEEDP
jgi:hypothetical protein